MEELKRVVLETTDACEMQHITDWTAIKSKVKSNLSGYLYKTMRRSPMILPVISEIQGAPMNIQIFGKSKCFDTKKAERCFKERRIKYQFIDVLKYGMSRGELNSVKNAVGLEAMIDTPPSTSGYSTAFLPASAAIIPPSSMVAISVTA